MTPPRPPCDHCPRRGDGSESACPGRLDGRLCARSLPDAPDSRRWRAIVLDLPPLVPGSPYDVAAHNAAVARHSAPAPAPAETPTPPAPARPAPEPGLPSFARQVGGFLRSAASVVAGAMSDAVSGRMPDPLLDDAGYGARLAICRACDHYRPSDQRCGLATGCGCYLADRSAVPGKARYRDAACPIGKW